MRLQWAKEESPDSGRRSLTCEQRDPQVEEYLDQVVSRIGRTVNVSQRQGIKRELAAHLEALIDAYLELGSSQQDAIDAALRQFGSARKIGDAYRRSAQGALLSFRDCLIAAPLCLFAILYFGYVTLVMGEVFGTPAYTQLLSGPLVPLLLGFNWARRDTFRTEGWSPLWSVTAACALTTLLVPTPSYFGGFLPFHGLWFTAQLCMWLILACAAAGLRAAGRAVAARWNRTEAV